MNLASNIISLPSRSIGPIRNNFLSDPAKPVRSWEISQGRSVDGREGRSEPHAPLHVPFFPRIKALVLREYKSPDPPIIYRDAEAVDIHIGDGNREPKGCDVAKQRSSPKGLPNARGLIYALYVAFEQLFEASSERLPGIVTSFYGKLPHVPSQWPDRVCPHFCEDPLFSPFG
jgi:hypothetical protein